MMQMSEITVRDTVETGSTLILHLNTGYTLYSHMSPVINHTVIQRKCSVTLFLCWQINTPAAVCLAARSRTFINPLGPKT